MRPSPRLLEGRHHLVGDETQAPRLELERDVPARIQLGDDPVRAEMMAPAAPFDHQT